MNARIRAVTLGALWLACGLLVSPAAAEGLVPEWQQDLDYLTWDRRAEEPTTVGGPVFLHPDGERASTISSVTPAPTWQLRIRDFYTMVTPRGLRALVSRRDAQEDATTLSAPGPNSAVQQPVSPVGPVAQRNDWAAGQTAVQ
jgi:hypothetical protein